jgi:nitrite reductase/ring-hydroxylating ferredoxin subunit
MLFLYHDYYGMITISKIKVFFILSITVFLLVSCHKSKNDVIPDVVVDFTIDILDYPALQAVTGSAIVDKNDTRINDRRYAGGFNDNGIIIYHSLEDEFLAYDRTCPHDYAVNNIITKVNVDFTQALCPRCSTYYSLFSFGTPVDGPGKYPLKNYKTQFDGRFLRVWNNY